MHGSRGCILLESVSYNKINWDIVSEKLSHAMSSDRNFEPTECKELDGLIVTLRDVVRYHSSSVNETSFQLVAKMFTKWESDSLGNVLHLGFYLLFSFGVLVIEFPSYGVSIFLFNLSVCVCVLCVIS